MRDRTNYPALVRRLRARMAALQWQRDADIREARTHTAPDERRFWVCSARIHNRQLVKHQRRVNVYQGRKPHDNGHPAPVVQLPLGEGVL